MRERASAMRGRVVDRFSQLRGDARDVAMLDAALSAALAIRDDALTDDHHIDALHPARTVLILIDDVGIADPFLLSIAAFLESHDARLAVPAALVTSIDPEAARAVHSIPTPLTCDDDALLERLLSLPPDYLTVALAERLDHARHLHLRQSAGRQAWLDFETRTYLPLALRHGGLLGKRYQRWHSALIERVREQG